MKKILTLAFLMILAGCGSETKQQAAPATAVTFSNLQSTVLGPSCGKCHGPGAKNGIELHSYEAIMASGKVVAGNPEASELYQSVVEGRMPKKGAPLTPEQIAAIGAWIKSGARND